MERVMIHILNMGFAASCAVLAVIFLRQLLKSLPKGYIYGLWLVVLFRFLCPITFTAPVSLFPVNPKPLSQEIVYDKKPEVQTGVIWVDRAVNDTVMGPLAPKDDARSVNPIQIVLAAGFLVWAAGAALFFLYHLIQYIRWKMRLSTAVPAEDNLIKEAAEIPVRVSDQIPGAFTMGIFRPVIYLPAGLTEEEAGMILCHEKVHIRRKDGFVRFLWLAAVMIHWFQPLAWLGFRMMCADMEMSCDEQVLKEKNRAEKACYSKLLLREAERSKTLFLPLAFGKHSVYQRIRHILSYRRPGKAVQAVSIIILAGAAIGLMGNPGKKEGDVGVKGDTAFSEELGEPSEGGTAAEAGGTDEESSAIIIGGADGPTSIFLAGKLGGESEKPQGERELSLEGRPDADWLASVELDWDGGNSLTLDVAEEDVLIFHGDFGLFAFGKDSYGCWKQQMFLSDQEGAKIFLEGLKAAGALQDGGSIGREDRLIGRGAVSSKALDFDVVKRQDGTVAVLGAAEEDVRKGRLINLWYGYYDPQEQVMRQAYLFLGDGKETVNGEGQVGECRYLFSREGCPYYLRTPKSMLSFEEGMFSDAEAAGEDGTERNFQLPYDRLELVRDTAEGEEVLDALLCMAGQEQQKVILTEERIVYTAAFEKTSVSVKTPGLVSLRYDGTGRCTSNIPYQVYNGLSYDDGWIYYEGWTNDQTFPRPLVRVTPDFSRQEKVGELEGSLIAVRDHGVCWQMDWEEGRIMAEEIDALDGEWMALEDTEKGKGQKYTLQELEDGRLKVTVSQPGQEASYYLQVPQDKGN